MTIEQKQELLVLDALLAFPNKIFTSAEYDDIASKVVGGSSYVVRESLGAKNYLLVGRHFVDESIPIWPERYDRIKWGVQVTDICKKSYRHLKTKKKWDTAKEIAFWVILAATLITLWFTISDRVLCNKPSDKESSQQYKDTSKLKEIPMQPLPPETTSVQTMNLDDSLTKLKNDSLKQ